MTNTIELMVLVFIMMLFSKYIEKTYKIIMPITLMFLGITVSLFSNIDFNFDILMFSFLPFLLLYDSMNINIKEFYLLKWIIFFKAVMACILMVGFFLLLEYSFNIFNISLLTLTMIITIIMATDTVSVSVILGRIKSIPMKIKHIIEYESLVNDITAILLITIIVTPLCLGQILSFDNMIIQSFKIISGSILIGIIVGYTTFSFMKFFDKAIAELLLIIITAYTSFILAEHLHCSGIISIVISIVTFMFFLKKSLLLQKDFITLERVKYNKELIEQLSVIAVGIIFVAMGTTLNIFSIIDNIQLIFLVFLFMTIFRFIMSYSINFFLKKNEKIKLLDVLIITFSGIRGGLGILLAHMLPNELKDKELIITVVTGIVILTTIIYSTILIVITNESFLKFKNNTIKGIDNEK